MTDQNEEDLFDHADEDKDLENQVKRGTEDTTRNDREGTPGPQVNREATPQTAEASETGPKISESPLPATTEKLEKPDTAEKATSS
jgi:protein phosphatase 2C family protein 2/3